MMIGTNDLLSDGNNATLADRLDSVSQNLLNDMDTIVEAMFQANEHANVIILTIPLLDPAFQRQFGRHPPGRG